MNDIYIFMRERYEPMVGYYKPYKGENIYSDEPAYLFYEINGNVNRGTLIFESELEKLIPFNIETYEKIRKEYLIKKYEFKLKSLKNDN